VLIGKAHEVADLLTQYRDRLGLDLLVLRSAAHLDEAERRASLQRLVEHVLPRL
jgi:alkanesulfonate monooxygenase SsuD/methylene tetrahydromethanopterin reductase-like flavin-dependent oxidoreductase (luciferase family)